MNLPDAIQGRPRKLTADRLYEALVWIITEAGVVPSIRELSDELNVSSSTVCTRLAEIEAMGWIMRTPGKCRSIILKKDLPGIESKPRKPTKQHL